MKQSIPPHLVLSQQRLQSTDLSSLGILSMARSYLDLGVVLEMLRVIKQATPIIRSHDNVLPFATKVSCSDQPGPDTFNFIPQCNLFIWNIPQAELAIQ